MLELCVFSLVVNAILAVCFVTQAERSHKLEKLLIGREDMVSELKRELSSAIQDYAALVTKLENSKGNHAALGVRYDKMRVGILDIIEQDKRLKEERHAESLERGNNSTVRSRVGCSPSCYD